MVIPAEYFVMVFFSGCVVKMSSKSENAGINMKTNLASTAIDFDLDLETQVAQG